MNYKLLSVILFALALSPLAAKPAEASVTPGLSAHSFYTTPGDHPAFVYIPSINLFSYVQGVGIDWKGNMDVPSGRSNNVGWYQYGTIPGETGTAILDAHNTAAFKNLHAVPAGGDIYVFTMQGKMLHFTVSQANTYSMSTIRPEHLYTPTSSRQMNLITCAGTLLGNGEATHRLIVTAQLASDNIGTVSSTVSS